MVSTDTIQLLLKQRQELRESLMALRRDIASLDENSRTLVEKNIPKQTPLNDPSGAPLAPAAASASSPSTTVTPPPFPESPTHPDGDPAPPVAADVFPPHRSEPEAAPAAPADAPAADLEAAVSAPVEAIAETPVAPPAPAPRAAEIAEPVAPPPASAASEAAAEAAPQAAPDPLPAPDPEPLPAEGVALPDSPPDAPAAASAVEITPPDVPEPLSRALETKAAHLSAYLAEHPSRVDEADLAALDTAIVAAASADAAARGRAYQELRAAYRKVATKSFAVSGVTGTTLEDSAAGAPLLWILPFSLSLLILIAFPLLLLLRTLAGEMFTADFAADVTWSIGAVAGFLWGAVGALTQIALNVALAVFRRRFDGGIRHSPFLRAGLGGMTGALIFLGLEFVLPMTSAAAEFMLDMAAFAGGLLSTLLFALLQSLISFLEGLFTPADPKPAATQRPKK
ncbi:hypothetical protein [Sneathiella sp.]|uniref:hypothetical protein n=1 Tax=Sneathiella sp. TaxID=1964365 RepID=UPI002FE329B4